MTSESKSSARIAPLVGYITCAIAIGALALLYSAPADRHGRFWLEVVWLEFLCALVWMFLSGFYRFLLPSPSNTAGLGGALPASRLVIVGYAFISAIVLIAGPNSYRLEGIVQVVLIVVSVIGLVFIELSRVGAIAGAHAPEAEALSPDKLVLMLLAREGVGQTEGADAKTSRQNEQIKALRESVQYSLPGSAIISRSISYRRFAEGVETICGKLDVASSDPGQSAAENLDALMKLRAQVPAIAAELKVSLR